MTFSSSAVRGNISGPSGLAVSTEDNVSLWMLTVSAMASSEPQLGRSTQISVSVGFNPGHSLSGRVATVLENSRKILHSTLRKRMPSPQEAEHWDHWSVMKLRRGR